MLDKLLFTDKEMKSLSKSLVVGLSIGLLVGAIFNLTHIGFALGGVAAVTFSVIKSYYNRIRNTQKVLVKASKKNLNNR